jgi:DUF1009 family protein
VAEGKPRRIGLIAGGGRLPHLFASAARERGLSVVAVAHSGETDPSLEGEVDAITWVRVGQLARMARALRKADIDRAVMIGGIRRARAFRDARPDLAGLRVVFGLRSLRDDALLRAVAGYFEERGIAIVPQTELFSDLLARPGHLAGPAVSASQQKDVALGLEVAQALGRADIGQTVVVKDGRVLAVEAAEGTDETIRRGARIGGAGVVVVKLCKPGQDERFDLPAVGRTTLEVMTECGARVLAIEAGKTLLIDTVDLLAQAERARISVVGVSTVARPPTS